MGKSVTANGRTILHKGHGATHVCAIPDVCKTPSPGGPIPIPYVNIAKDGDLSKGSKKVKIEGNPIALKDSALGTSTGDEAGTAGGGLMSSKTKGKMAWAAVSMDVKVEGKGVARFMDPTQHNGNTYNSAFISMGGTGLAYGDDGDGICSVCSKPAADHRIMEMKESSAKIASEIMKRLHGAPKKHANPPRGKNKKLGGYMLGVLVCNCNTWATNSGQTHAALGQAAGGCVIVGGGALQPGTLSAGMGKKASAEIKRVFSEAKMINMSKALPDRNVSSREFSYPGACAAQKLISAARGHELLSLTEVFFDPGEDPAKLWAKSYTIASKFGKSPNEKLIPMKARAYTKEDAEKGATDVSVPSCQTCQTLVPLLLCGKNDWKC